MSDALDHIAAWEAAGLIDRPTADRLRAAGDLAAGHDTPATGTTAATEMAATAEASLRHDRPLRRCSARA